MMPTLADRLRAETRRILLETLLQTSGNVTRAADELGLSVRQTFRLKADLLTSHDIKVIETKALETRQSAAKQGDEPHVA